MTDKKALLTLADRCEAAPPEEQCTLLKEARRLLFPAPKMDDLPLSSSPYWAWVSAEILFGTQLDHHAYVDAALSMLPEGWLLAELSNLGVAGGSRCVLGNPGTGSSAYSDHGAQSRALAITATLLRAKAQEVE